MIEIEPPLGGATSSRLLKLSSMGDPWISLHNGSVTRSRYSTLAVDGYLNRAERTTLTGN